MSWVIPVGIGAAAKAGLSPLLTCCKFNPANFLIVPHQPTPWYYISAKIVCRPGCTFKWATFWQFLRMKEVRFLLTLPHIIMWNGEQSDFLQALFDVFSSSSRLRKPSIVQLSWLEIAWFISQIHFREGWGGQRFGQVNRHTGIMQENC